MYRSAVCLSFVLGSVDNSFVSKNNVFNIEFFQS